MHLLVRLLVLLGVLFVVTGVSAEPAGPAAEHGPAEDVENARTPGDVLELLPKDGEPDLASAFWVIFEVEGAGSGYFSWSFEQTDVQVIFESRSGGLGSKQVYDRLVYSAKGKLHAYQMVKWGEDYFAAAAGVVDDGVWALTWVDPHREPGDNNPSHSRHPLTNVTTGLTDHWLPAIAAYHARRGNLGFRTKWMKIDAEELRPRGDLAVELMGSEEVEHNGESIEAHIMRVRVREPGADFDAAAGPDEEWALTLTVLEDGTLYRFAGDIEGAKIKGQVATQDEVVKQFKLDLEATPAFQKLPNE